MRSLRVAKVRVKITDEAKHFSTVGEESDQISAAFRYGQRLVRGDNAAKDNPGDPQETAATIIQCEGSYNSLGSDLSGHPTLIALFVRGSSDAAACSSCCQPA
jgi:hypothetical protein